MFFSNFSKRHANFILLINKNFSPTLAGLATLAGGG